MPGATFMPTVAGVPGPAATAAAPAARSSAVSPGAFLFWLAIFGVVVPVVILGGLNAGRFRFVYVGK